jgi:hypothetical protein
MYKLIILLSIITLNTDESILTIEINNSKTVCFNKQKIEIDNPENITFLNDYDRKIHKIKKIPFEKKSKSFKTYRHMITYGELGLQIGGKTTTRRIKDLSNLWIKDLIISFKEQQKIDIKVLDVKINHLTTYDDIYNNKTLKPYLRTIFYDDTGELHKQVIFIDLEHHYVTIEFGDTNSIGKVSQVRIS